MIIKSKGLKDKRCIARTVRYLFRDDKSASLLYARYLPSGASIETMIEKLELVEQKRIRRRKDSVILFHDVISFHARDSHKLEDDGVLRTIAKKYSLMRKDAINLCVLHRETDHIHIHVLAGCNLDGRSSRVSKEVFQAKKLELERFQQLELRLVHSRVKHVKEVNLSLTHAEQELKRSGRVSEKERLALEIKELAKRVQNQNQLEQVLIENDITPYFIKNKLVGVWNKKGTRKYRLKKLGIDLENLDVKRSRLEERRENWEEIERFKTYHFDMLSHPLFLTKITKNFNLFAKPF